jgi:hypothetical protein
VTDYANKSNRTSAPAKTAKEPAKKGDAPTTSKSTTSAD